MKIWTFLLLAAVATSWPANGSAAVTPAANGVAAGLAQPAMPAGLDCIGNGLSPEERRGVAQFAMDGSREDPRALPLVRALRAVAQVAAEQGSREDPRVQPLVRALDACASELSWSQQKRVFAVMYAISAAGLAALQEELTGQGLDLGELDQAIESDQPLMAAANADQLGGTAGQEFAERHAATIERMMGDRSDDVQLAFRMGNYIAFRVLALAAANRFAQEP